MALWPTLTVEYSNCRVTVYYFCLDWISPEAHPVGYDIMTFDREPENDSVAQDYVCPIVYASLENSIYFNQWNHIG